MAYSTTSGADSTSATGPPPARCRKHVWADAFPPINTYPAAAYFGTSRHYDWDDFRVCTECGKFGVGPQRPGSGRVRALPDYEASVYGLDYSYPRWQEIIKAQGVGS